MWALPLQDANCRQLGDPIELSGNPDDDYLEPVGGAVFEFVDGLAPVVAGASFLESDPPWCIRPPILPCSPSIPFRPILPCSMPSRIIPCPMPGAG